MDQQTMLKTAQAMFLENKGRKEVLDFFATHSVKGELAETMATAAFKSIQAQRQEMIQVEKVEERKGGTASILVGLAFLVGGIIATLFTNRLWYGAMIVGVISIRVCPKLAFGN